MKKFLLATTLLAGAMTSAQAADLATRKSPPPAALPVMAQYNWTGFYAGIQGGGGFGGNSRHTNGAVRSGQIELSGGLVGVTLGYNHQFGNFVAGIEGDYAWSSLNGSSGTNCAAPGCKTDIRSFGTLRGRLGYSFDRIMPYVTGGLAIADIKHSAGAFSGSDFRAGWAIGGGVEAALTRNISVKGEYLYYDFARQTYNSAGNLGANANGHILRAGVNYKF
ncbi:outer membrane protein [Rhabdaerophilum sp. SD176]|uniref:outer membrane protein n=1 Tax=Rhabdaerophilum sp. SD176 TaxID=2983548 RepID=UPI0024DF3273|nr:outer membrane protein [Rhabdaerophilum sp. SD176]